MLENVGVALPEVLLPGAQIPYKSWAVIACDQFTHSREYWDETHKTVGENPSTLHMILPEIDLDQTEQLLPRIHQTMEQYKKEVLTRKQRGFIYVRRQSPNMLRRGLIMAVDLEMYDYNKGSTSLIRATEGTILDRLPPRMRIRENACLESPHILLLVDDPQCTLIEPLEERMESMSLLYDFDLMQDGGHISGHLASSGDEIARISKALEALAAPALQEQKYGEEAKEHPLLFAVGDGNHSLATAKACWMKRKETLHPGEAAVHPARWALVEVGNLHDEQLHFEPIHRVLYHVNPREAMEDFAAWLQENKGEGGIQSFRFLHGQEAATIHTGRGKHTLQVGTLQLWLDDYLTRNTEALLDYVHGEDEAAKLCAQDDVLAMILPAPDKSGLFKSVLKDGSLPRKTFSMGEARDKRYYLECRAITP